MERAQKADKPIKLANFVEMRSGFESNAVIKLGDYSMVEYSGEDLPFSKVKTLIDQNSTMSSVDQIINTICIGETVNIEVYVDLESSEVIEVSTCYGVKKKREVSIYDDSTESVLRFTIWNHHLSSFPASGMYKLSDVKVNSYRGKYLTTTASSSVKESSGFVKRRSIPGAVLKKVSFPAETVDVYDHVYFCRKCNRQGIPTGKFLCCESCHATSLMSICEQRFNVRATFGIDADRKISLNIPHQEFVQFVNVLNIDIKDRDLVNEAMLTSNKYEASYMESTNTVISITGIAKD